MDIENIIYIAIFILFSLFSGNKANKKKREREREQESEAPDSSLEEEIRKMAERMMGKVEEPTPTKQPTEYRSAPQQNSYETYEGEGYDTAKPLETVSAPPVINYSQQDIERAERENERFRNGETKVDYRNYEAEVVESLKKGKEKHSVIDRKSVAITDRDVAETVFEFDGRKAIIYAEILRRPEY